MTVVVYTALFGNKDHLWVPYPPGAEESNVRFVCFTERKRDQVGLWTHSYISESDIVLTGSHVALPPVRVRWEQRIVKPAHGDRLSARYYKTSAHKLFPDADATIWVDANVRMLCSVSYAIKNWLGGADLAAFNHPSRRCCYDEAAACAELGKANRGALRKQVHTYRSDGMPRRWGLASTRCVIRRNNLRIREFEKLWWQQLLAHSVRDQVSFPYVCWKLGLKWNVIPEHADVPGREVSSKLFWYIPHKGAR